MDNDKGYGDLAFLCFLILYITGMFHMYSNFVDSPDFSDPFSFSEVSEEGEKYLEIDEKYLNTNEDRSKNDTKKGAYIEIDNKRIYFPIHKDDLTSQLYEIYKNGNVSKNMDVGYIMNNNIVYGLDSFEDLNVKFPYGIRNGDTPKAALEKITSYKDFRNNMIYFEVYNDDFELVQIKLKYNKDGRFTAVEFVEPKREMKDKSEFESKYIEEGFNIKLGEEKISFPISQEELNNKLKNLLDKGELDPKVDVGYIIKDNLVIGLDSFYKFDPILPYGIKTTDSPEEAYKKITSEKNLNDGLLKFYVYDKNKEKQKVVIRYRNNRFDAIFLSKHSNIFY